MRASGVGRAVLCAMVVAAGSAAAQSDVGALVAHLGSADHRAQLDAYRELQRTRPPEAVGLLAQQLATFTTYAQGLGISLLQRYPIDQTRGAHRRLLATGGPFLRAASAAALYRSGDRSAAAVIADAIAEATDPERAMVLTRLHGIDDARVTDAVRALVRAPGSANDLENALYHLLTSTGTRDEATVRAAVDRLEHPGSDARARAACAAYLVATGETRYGPALATAIEEDRTAVTRLMRFLSRAPALGEELTAALAEFLAGARNQAEVNYATRVLKEHATHAAVVALRRLLDDEDAKVRQAALKAISEIPGGLDSKVLRRMLTADEPEIALIAADTLRRMDDGSGLGRVLELVRAAGPGRLRAVEVLGGFRVRAAVPPLLDALEDDDESVRSAAFHALRLVWTALFPFRRIDISTTGYRPEASAGERARGVTALRTFWNASK